MMVSFRRVALAGALAISGAVGVALPAAAQTSSPAAVDAATAGGVQAQTYSASLVPTTPGHVVFAPSNHVSGHVVPKNACTQTHNTFSVVNRTRVTQQFLSQGKPFGPPIPASTPTSTHFLYDCQFGPGTFVYGVAGHPLAHLTVTVTP